MSVTSLSYIPSSQGVGLCAAGTPILKEEGKIIPYPVMIPGSPDMSPRVNELIRLKPVPGSLI